MKRKTATIFITSILAFIVLSSLNAVELNTGRDKYTGSLYKGNYVWGGAMSLAWTELADSVIHEAIKLNTDNPKTLETLGKFNNPVFTKKDLDAASYYIKSGYGQKTVEAINRECRKKFPTKSFADLNMKLEPTDIISYAYFLKVVKYKGDFPKKNMRFNNKLVKGFGGEGGAEVLEYADEDHFVVRIPLKDETDQIYLAKGYPMDKPDEIVARLSRKDRYGDMMHDGDIFKAPMLHLDYTHSYDQMTNTLLANKQFAEKKYEIKAMLEKARFDMDEKGARVEFEGYINISITDAPPDTKHIPRIMILDKPYWVVMVRSDSFNPYFILGVNNTSIMNTVK